LVASAFFFSNKVHTKRRPAASFLTGGLRCVFIHYRLLFELVSELLFEELIFVFLPELFPEFELELLPELVDGLVLARRDSAEARPPALATRSRVSLLADASPRRELLLSCCPRLLPLLLELFLLFGIYVVLRLISSTIVSDGEYKVILTKIKHLHNIGVLLRFNVTYLRIILTIQIRTQAPIIATMRL
jgi:hypothetical protein